MNMKMLPADLFAYKNTDQPIPSSMQTAPAQTSDFKNSDAWLSNNQASVLNRASAKPPATTVNQQAARTSRNRPRMHMTSPAKSTQRRKVSLPPVPKAQYYLCTVTDMSYLIKVLAQYRSIEQITHDFCLYVCCTDNETYDVLSALRLPGCIPISLDHIGDNELYTLKNERKDNEFCWTLKSYLMLFLLEKCGLPHLLYCDGDIGFANDPALLYRDWGTSSIYLCTQRDVDWVEKKYGKYQAGILGIRNNENGLHMLRWWKQKCREWCYNYADGGRLGDQKYLDDVPALFNDVKISTNRGINAAPWNIVYNNNYNISAHGNQVVIDGDPLVAYHFACINMYNEYHFDLWNLGNISIQPVVRSNIYVPYLKLLRDAMGLIKKQVGNLTPLFSPGRFEDAKTPFIYSENNLKLLDWNNEYAFCTITSRTYVARTLALYSSIRRYLSNFHMWICCVDDTAYAILSRFGLEHTTLLHVKNVETPEILATRSSKTIAEYCWTLKPALCSHVFEHYNVNRLLYCDSDIYFFSHPRPIHELWTNYTTLLNKQLGTSSLEGMHGMYQAGMIGFTKAAESLEILRWWQKKCTQWCYDDHSDPDRWGDQKYLQKIPDLFKSIRINDRYGLVAAPWNIVMNNIRNLQVSRAGSEIYLGSEKLVAYHFGSINMLSENMFDLWKLEPLSFNKRIIEHIYTPYLMHLRAICQAIQERGFNTSMLFESVQNVQNPFSLTLPQQKEDNYAKLSGR